MILITRPLAQTENLKTLLEASDIDYAFFPTFEVKKISTQVLSQKYDVIIFISVNAVNYAEDYFNKIFTGIFKIFAVGPITAKKLIDQGIKVDCYPKFNASSKELLSMQECLELSGKNILIVRGKGGSETLKDNLRKFNQVDYLEVYERVPCKFTNLHAESMEVFLNSPEGVLMASSNESLYSIVKLFKSHSFNSFNELKLRKLIVFSQKIKVLADKLGFINIKVTLNPSDQDLIDELINEKK
jgi:uroporphyrinogen-III synthase